MSLRPAGASLFASAVALSAIALVACGGFGPIQTCGEIPTDGCPLGRGGTCGDVYCAGLYDCVDGAWELVETCSQVVTSSASSSSSSGTGGGTCVAFDHSVETSGCKPDLENPDCPAVAAETCGDPCSTGCTDFFLCTESGWLDVGYCSEDGAFVITQPGAGG